MLRMSSQIRRFLPGPFFLSLFGVLFSLWNIWGEPEALCVTGGCDLFGGFAVAGVSLWWGGVAGCAVLLLVSIPGAAVAGVILAGIGLVLDMFLLTVMLVTAPCFPCLIIGLVLALTYRAFRLAVREERRQRRPLPTSALLVAWSVLFVVNVGGVVREEVTPWALTVTGGEGPGGIAPSEAAVQIYFSPSCPACVKLVEALDGSSAAPSGGVAWYPVEEGELDAPILADMEKRMRGGAGLSSAMNAARAASAPRQDRIFPGGPLLRLRLWINRAHVLAAGSSRLPFVEFRGAPAALSRNPEKGPAASAGTSSVSSALSVPPAAGGGGTELPFLGVVGFCDGSEPCSDPAVSGPLTTPSGSSSVSAPAVP